VSEWEDRARRGRERYRDGEARLPEEPDERQRQLTRIGNAAYGAGLSLLVAGREAEAREWLHRAARRYRESWEHAPPGSWGRPIAALKCRLLSSDAAGAEEEARWALAAGAAEASSPIGLYAACLALLALGRDEEARPLADGLRTRDDFPEDVGTALAMLAAGSDAIGYVEAVESVLESFETRDEYLEDVPVADTVLVLQALAEPRGLTAELNSPLLPSGGGRTT
jgi:hypothetical protein